MWKRRTVEMEPRCLLLAKLKWILVLWPKAKSLCAKYYNVLATLGLTDACQIK